MRNLVYSITDIIMIVADGKEVGEINRSALLNLSTSFLNHLTDKERMQLIDHLTEHYCIHCGTKQPKSGQRCQCWSDE